MVTRMVRLYGPDGTDLGELVAHVEGTIELGDPVTQATMTVYDDRPVADGQLVEVTYAGTVTTWMIDGQDETAFVKVGRLGGDPRKFTLVGGAALLRRSAVDAEGGMSRDAAHLRPVGPARYGYDDSGWVAPASSGTQANPITEAGRLQPDGWEMPGDTVRIHPVSDGIDYVDPGIGLLRTEFTITADTDLTVQLTSDGQIEDPIWIAGRQPFGPITGRMQWHRTFTETFRLIAGNYAVFVATRNIIGSAHFLLAAKTAAGTLVLQTNTATWRAWPEYPVTVMPGETAGIILDLFIGEGIDRDEIPGSLDTAFTATTDSGDQPWTYELQWAYEVRVTTVLDVLRQLIEQVALDHADLVLSDTVPRVPQLRVWQDYGTDRTAGPAAVRWERDGEVVEATADRAAPQPNDVWTLTPAGWVRHRDLAAQDRDGIIAGGLTAGRASSPEAFAVPGLAQLGDQAEPRRRRYTIRDTDRCRAGRDWWVGDTVAADGPDTVDDVRVLSITFDTTQDVPVFGVVVAPQ